MHQLLDMQKNPMFKLHYYCIKSKQIILVLQNLYSQVEAQVKYTPLAKKNIPYPLLLRATRKLPLFVPADMLMLYVCFIPEM